MQYFHLLKEIRTSLGKLGPLLRYLPVCFPAVSKPLRNGYRPRRRRYCCYRHTPLQWPYFHLQKEKRNSLGSHFLLPRCPPAYFPAVSTPLQNGYRPRPHLHCCYHQIPQPMPYCRLPKGKPNSLGWRYLLPRCPPVYFPAACPGKGLV